MRILSHMNCSSRGGGFDGSNSMGVQQQGFSLVEITIAIGVVAFAFVSLMALLPTGLNVFRQAMDTTVTAQIAQRITTELQETDYHTLLSATHLDGASSDPVTREEPAYGTLPRRYFDDQGNEIRPTSGKGELSEKERLRVLYEAHVRISRDRQLLGYEPGGKDERVGSRNLATAVVEVITNPAAREIKVDPVTQLLDLKETKLPLQTYPAFIAGNGSDQVNK
jgi:uncharacterized protein (TIGR02598 family)